MSGESPLNNADSRVREAARIIAVNATCAEHRAFAAHLESVAKGLQQMEWVLAGDISAGEEIDALRKVVDARMEARYTVRLLEERIAEAQQTLARLRKESADSAVTGGIVIDKAWVVDPESPHTARVRRERPDEADPSRELADILLGPFKEQAAKSLLDWTVGAPRTADTPPCARETEQGQRVFPLVNSAGEKIVRCGGYGCLTDDCDYWGTPYCTLAGNTPCLIGRYVQGAES